MYPLKYTYLLLFIFDVCKGQRKIAGGFKLTSYKKYVVYLVRSEQSDQIYDTWLCGGALVSTEYVITSAACVQDVHNIYVIAGYNKYVPYDKMEKDACIQSVRKKVVLTCVPKTYEFDYLRADKWSYIDIAVIKVESPYNFNDADYFKHCTFVPAPILINYEIKYQKVDKDVLVFGWGHLESWRKPDDPTNYNQEDLRYAPTIIIDKETCKTFYKLSYMSKVIDDYMICTWGAGNLLEDGVTIVKYFGNATCCGDPKTTKAMRLLRNKLLTKNPNHEQELNQLQKHRQEIASFKETVYPESSDLSSSENYDGPGPVFRARRAEEIGICQNDHGGPLVTWAGKQEILIGVASVFMVDKNRKCRGPYLHTSTQCNGKFLACVLRSEKVLRALNYGLEFCLQPPGVKGFDIIETHISWINHPDGPADNEKLGLSANVTNAAATTAATGVIRAATDTTATAVTNANTATIAATAATAATATTVSTATTVPTVATVTSLGYQKNI